MSRECQMEIISLYPRGAVLGVVLKSFRERCACIFCLRWQWKEQSWVSCAEGVCVSRAALMLQEGFLCVQPS